VVVLLIVVLTVFLRFVVEVEAVLVVLEVVVALNLYKVALLTQLAFPEVRVLLALLVKAMQEEMVFIAQVLIDWLEVEAEERAQRVQRQILVVVALTLAEMAVAVLETQLTKMYLLQVAVEEQVNVQVVQVVQVAEGHHQVLPSQVLLEERVLQTQVAVEVQEVIQILVVV
jgi:hypothetical protein